MKKILYSSIIACSMLAAHVMQAEDVSGKSFMRPRPFFQEASPEKVALSGSDKLAGVKNGDKGAFELVVGGGMNTNRKQEAAYYMPYGHQEFTVDGKLELEPCNTMVAYNDGIGNTGNGQRGILTAQFQPNIEPIAITFTAPADPSDPGQASMSSTEPGSIQYDPNTDTSIMRPWNFGIDIAALYEPEGKPDGGIAGQGLLTNPEFKATLAPEVKQSVFGIGAALRYHFSDEPTGFFAEASTALQRTRVEWNWNENVETDKRDITSSPAEGNPADNRKDTSNNPLPFAPSLDTYVNAAGATGADDGGEATGFPIGDAAPQNFTQAFAQEAWQYGRVDGAQSKTKLADIELKVGYQTVLEDSHSLNSYIGLVIPTGTKNDGKWLAPAQVGNGKHFAFMSGGTIDMVIAQDQDFRVAARCDANFRYLFKNTQKRSFDVIGKPWSRYMFVWENQEAFDTAAENAQGALRVKDLAYVNTRAYTPGINVFTQDMHVTPRAQMRCNLALLLGSEKIRGELGWNIMARQAEKVELAQAWEQSPAFADASFVYPGVNNARTLYNDALFQGNNFQFNAETAATLTGAGALKNDTDPKLPIQDYNKYQITAKDLDLASAASPSVVSHTPYASLGYVWDNEKMPVFLSAGASYEFTFENRFTNQWQLFGKMHINF